MQLRDRARPLRRPAILDELGEGEDDRVRRRLKVRIIALRRGEQGEQMTQSLVFS
jgi:hypothetical protein